MVQKSNRPKSGIVFEQRYLFICNVVRNAKVLHHKLNICVMFEVSEGYDHRSRITHISMIGFVAKGDTAEDDERRNDKASRRSVQG